MLILFWGCRDRAGHYLHQPRRSGEMRDFECERLALPKPHHLDGGPMFLPYPEKRGEGALTYLPANDRTILAWWGSPFDGRGKVNSAIITEGRCDVAECWRRFAEAFPDLAPKLTMPTVTKGI